MPGGPVFAGVRWVTHRPSKVELAGRISVTWGTRCWSRTLEPRRNCRGTGASGSASDEPDRLALAGGEHPPEQGVPRLVVGPRGYGRAVDAPGAGVDVAT